jgi:hypothetical protein
LFQVGGLAYARFTPWRYFSWAPYDSRNDYTLDVTINGRSLSQADVVRRYGLTQYGREMRAILHVKDVVEHYETTRGRGDNARVVLRYSTNDIPQPTWTWPPDTR